MSRVGTLQVGTRFGRITLVGFCEGKPRKILCRCDCGRESLVCPYNFVRGMQRSCGRSGCKPVHLRHGHSIKGHESPTHASWRSMLERCTNSRTARFKDYGGRGITVCERWRIFENFLADMGERPLGKSIDRIDVNGNYEPGNCRWATAKEQVLNRRRHGIKPKLSDVEASQVAWLACDGGFRQCQIALAFGVYRTTIARIVKMAKQAQ